MAVKTFTQGEKLTSADTNTYLTNGGLVYIKSQTVGTAVSSVTVSSAFSATYDAYKIIITGGAGSTAADMRINLDGSTASYYSGIFYHPYGTAGPSNVQGLGQANIAYWNYMGGTSTGLISVHVDVINPFLTKFTTISSYGSNTNTLGSLTWANGYHNVAASYTGITFTPSAGTLTGGTIIVYGYRQA